MRSTSRGPSFAANCILVCIGSPEFATSKCSLTTCPQHIGNIACRSAACILQGKAAKGKIPVLRWDQFVWKTCALRLQSGCRKTGRGRRITLNQTLTTLVKSATRYLTCPGVLLSPEGMNALQGDPESSDPRYHTIRIVQVLGGLQASGREAHDCS